MSPDPQRPPPALRLQGICLDYPGTPGVLQEIDLAVAPGELVVLSGRSGSGKSSLLAVATGLEEPTAGTVEVAGRRLPQGADAAKVRAASMGLIFQHLHLLPELSVTENVALPLRLAGVPARHAHRRATRLLEQFDILALAARRPPSLSGGEQQRVAVARALAREPAVVLADEPTSSLDRENALKVIHALQQARRLGAAVVVATHDPLWQGIGTSYAIDAGRIVPHAGHAPVDAAPAAVPRGISTTRPQSIPRQDGAA